MKLTYFGLDKMVSETLVVPGLLDTVRPTVYSVRQCGNSGNFIILQKTVRDGPLENLRGGEVLKKYSRKGKLNEKKFILWPKENSYKEFDDEKKFLCLENPAPPS